MSESLTILVIDDEAEIRSALRAIFEYQGWGALTADRVEEGLDLLRSDHPDIILIDYHMPQINGIDGVRMIRSLDTDVPIIVFTIDENQEVADRFLEAGATDFALKPVKAPDIISRIKLHVQLMNRLRASKMPIKGIGAPTLELISRQLSETGDAYLTANEISELTGLAYPTAYRYIQYMIEKGLIEVHTSYGKVGRPRQSFRLRRG